MRLNIVAAIVVSVMLAPSISVAGVSCSADLVLSGTVIGKEVNVGPSGSINNILLIVDTRDGNFAGVYCQRSLANLGLCNKAEVHSSIVATGNFIPNPYGGKWFSPISLTTLQ